MKTGIYFISKIKLVYFSCVILLFFVPHFIHSANYFISTDGLATNSGTISSPWSMTYGLSRYDLVPGDTVYVRGGEYLGQYICNLGCINGCSGNVILRNFQNERVIIRDTTTVTGGANTFIINRSHCTVWGLEVTSDPYLEHYGFKVGFANDVKIVNCIIHNYTNAGIGLSYPGKNNEIYGTIVCNGGHIDTITNQGRGHGMYIQNTCEDPSRPKKIENCFIFNNCRNGLNIFSVETYQCDIIVKDNVLFNGGAMVDTIAQPDRQLNFLSGGGSLGIARVNVKDNLFYRDLRGRNVKFGYASLDSSAFVEGNYIASMIGGREVVTMRDFNTAFKFHNNTLYSPDLVGIKWEVAMDSNKILNYDWDNNTYHKINTYNTYTAPQWQNAFYHDLNSNYYNSAPTTNFIKVVQNAYDLNRIHVSIVNWENLDDVIVDLNEYIPEGSVVKIYDVQNYLNGPYTTGTYSTTNGLSFDLTLTEIMEITDGPGRNLYSLPPHTSKSLGTFIVEFSGTTVNSIKTLEMASKIFPNPSNGIIQIELDDSFIIASAEYSIVDLQGHIMFNDNITTTKTTIDVSQLPEGIYFIELRNKTTRSVQKLSLIH